MGKPLLNDMKPPSLKGGILLSKSSFATMVPIRNMDRAVKFYTRMLGGSLNIRGEGDMKDYWASVNVGKTEFWLMKPEKREKRSLAYSTFLVKDIKRTAAGLKRKGVKFLRAEKMGGDSRIEGPVVYTPYGASAFFKDSEGNLLMLWQTPSM
jgi:predicted enzyme related to lactoylglutathione lyase